MKETHGHYTRGESGGAGEGTGRARPMIWVPPRSGARIFRRSWQEKAFSHSQEPVMNRMRRPVVFAALIFLVALPAVGQTGGGNRWVAAWTTAVVSRPAALPPAPPPANAQPVLPPVTPNNQTLPQIARSTIGGSRARVVFSNAFGTSPLTIGAASIALRSKESTIVPQSVRPLTLGGQRAFRIPAGAIIVSDAVDLAVPAMADL